MPVRLVSVRNMVIDKSPQENPALPVGENKPNYSHSWVHPRCGTTLQSPPEGRKNIPCDGCGVIVSIPDLETYNLSKNSTRKKSHRGGTTFGHRHEPKSKSGWGDLRVDNSKTKQTYSSSFSSEIVKVGKTLTKHFTGGRLLKAVVYVSPSQIMKLLQDNPGWSLSW